MNAITKKRIQNAARRLSETNGESLKRAETLRLRLMELKYGELGELAIMIGTPLPNLSDVKLGKRKINAGLALKLSQIK